jgi:hypothetical protein
MTTATAQAAPNIAFIKPTLAKLDRTNGKVYFGVQHALTSCQEILVA